MNSCYYFYANPYQAESIRAAVAFYAALKKENDQIKVWAPAWLQAHLPCVKISEQAPAFCRCALAFGGDGTLLRLAPMAAKANCPVIGVHTGHVGFLMSGDGSRAGDIAHALENEQYTLRKFPLLSVHIDGQKDEYLALNDVSLTRGSHPGVMALHVEADGEKVFTPHGDGVVLSTPLGSTAYALAAGAPIVRPDAPVVILTPVCAREMLSRPVILPDSACVTLTVPPLPRDEALLSLDGQTQMPLPGQSKVRVQKSALHLRMLRFAPPAFFETLRQKTALWNEL